MACYFPLEGWRSREINPTGKRSIVFNPTQGFADMPITLSCGKCIGCRLERSRQWAIRCVHEGDLYENNCFITLTYKPEELPKDGSLRISDYQKFMKKLRKHVAGPCSENCFCHGNLKKDSDKIRFFHCGEYGDKLSRPHYHACLFGLDFKDKEACGARDGIVYYTSKTLEAIWEKGFVQVGEMNFETAAYVARYITKKITGKDAWEYYNEVNKETGEILKERLAEYVTMSRRPGIGAGWLERFGKDVFPWDEVVMRGKKFKPPKFYLGKYELTSPNEWAQLKAKRKKVGLEKKSDNTPERLAVKRQIKEYKYKQLIRGYEK